MLRSFGVVDLGFGDSGKGITTAFLSKKYNRSSIVVRSNGGHQAGHTVIRDGRKHISSQFGSGVLMGVPTYLSKFFTVEPTSFMEEFSRIPDLDCLVYIDQMAMIVTPWDIERNRFKEERIGHGSVGVGFGETIKRNQDHYTLYFMDLYCESVLRAKVKNIAELYYGDLDIQRRELFIIECIKLRDSKPVRKVMWSDIKSGFENIIFESAQGILLDQYHGFFPNVTRSNTTSKNMTEILGSPLDEVFYVTRTYQTRHGNGFMTNEDKPRPELINNQEEINKTHPFQGEFRVTELDTELLKHSLRIDKNYSSKETSKNLVITCFDQYKIDIMKVVKDLETVVKFDKVYVSKSPDPKDFFEWMGRTSIKNY